MKLATLQIDGRNSAAVVRAGEAVTLAAYPDVGSLLAAGDAGLAAAAEAEAGDGWATLRGDSLRAPVQNPGAVLCVGMNFRSHILEMGRDLPEHPTLFAKLPRALAGPNDEIELPAVSSAVDYEGELVAVIGRAGRDIPRDLFDPARLVEDISRIVTLAPGDLIATGTPGGVGHAMDPPRYLADGDVVEVVAAEIGQLRNRFVAPT